MSAPLPTTAELRATRMSWHGVAELVLAGPQYRRTGEIRLRVVPGGFATVAEPDLRVERTVLIAGHRRLPLDGATPADLAAAVGVQAAAPADLYADGSGVRPDDRLAVDPAAAQALGDALELGDAALRQFAPDATPVLWPEHFDIAITVDEVNYGVSLGDTDIDEPYAYVGPWRPPTGAFWNTSFGAARPVRELPSVEHAANFYAEGRRHAAGTC